MSDKSSMNPASMNEDLMQAMTGIAGQYHELLAGYLDNQGNGAGLMDPLGISQTFLELTAAMMKQPEKIAEAQLQFWNAYTNLWLDSSKRFLGGAADNKDKAASADRRFRHEAWESNPFFDFIKESYLLTANSIQSLVGDIEGLDEKSAHKARFYTKQFVDAISPSNFVMTNPEVIEATISSRGENLVNGLQNFIEDFDKEKGQLRIKMTDTGAFELGKNVATTPGKVIFQNELMQLIQYAPSTAEVHRTPLLIIPPWINKFYILDLQPKNSMIKWLVDQGHTVFVISWVNPDETLGDKDFTDYIFGGPLAALDAITQATAEEKVNIVGYCIGGTLLGGLLSYMQATGDNRVRSATFFTALMDFSDPGDLGVFIDEEQLAKLEKQMSEKGFHDGAQMSMTFNMLRSNDLIWSFYVHNYLLGKEPFPFDLLYWNSDSTRLPAKMHSTYLRTMYLENKFREPGGISIADVPIDLREIEVPAYFISTEEDHIAPWKSTYLGAQLFSGPVRFVLGKSGHIAGIVNHPDANKYGYYTGADVDVDADDWYSNTEKHTGSWWNDWDNWLTADAPEPVPAREPGDAGLPALEDAPGSYVRVRV